MTRKKRDFLGAKGGARSAGRADLQTIRSGRQLSTAGSDLSIIVRPSNIGMFGRESVRHAFRHPP